MLGVYDGSTALINRAHTRTDNLNLTNIFDNVTSANNMSFWRDAANRLQNADGPWGSDTYTYDGVGNRTQQISTVGGSTTTSVFGYGATSNRLEDVSVGGGINRTFAHDAAGNLITDTRTGTAYTYVYNKAGRLSTVSVGGTQRAAYTYNAREQLTSRTITNMAVNGTTQFVHDLAGNVIAETDGTGASGTVREYIWLPESGVTDRPLVVVSDVNTASPQLLYVHVDHLNRPVMMTEQNKGQLWSAVWTPWGAPHSVSGAETLNARFPGQWFQLEAGLHYNWHRHYDPTTGRYTRPDPLGFVDGPSVYAYAGNDPLVYVDPDGQSRSRLRLPRRFNYDRFGRPRLDYSQWQQQHRIKNSQQCHRNSNEYVGPTHVYVIYGPNGRPYKIGESAAGTRVRDGASIRAENQIRKLQRESGDVYQTRIIRRFNSKKDARSHETRLIQRYRRRFGNGTLPGNKGVR